MQLMATAASVLISGIALSSVTYAWYVANTTVTAKTGAVSAMTNGMMLQIAAGTTPDYGKDSETIAFDSTKGHEISPSSTDDIKTWYKPAAWTDGAITVTSNGQPLDDKVAKSMRIGISTVDKNANETSTKNATYSHIYEKKLY